MSRPTATGSLRLPVAAFRCVLLVLCAALAVLPEGLNTPALARLGLLAVMVLVLSTLAWRGTAAVSGALLEALVTGVFIAGSGGSTSPLLPYLLGPGLVLGLYAGWRGALAGGVAAGLAIAGLSLTNDYPNEDPVLLVITAGQWVLLAVAVGVVAAVARRVSLPEQQDRVDRYAEAHALLTQLRAVSARLPGGLDAPSAASALLAGCAEIAPINRSAVLVHRGGEQLVPIAVSGTRRVPWRAPLSAPGPLRWAWEDRKPVIDVRKPDRAGRRKGSVLAAIPLLGRDEPYGLVVMESFQHDAFAHGRTEQLASVVEQACLQVETALLFEEVRLTATLEERDRLARQMHDGMAQDIAYLGYQLDALRPRAAVDPDLEAGLLEVRGQLTSLISDIRLSITDLRTSVDADRGLGAALSSYVRALSAGRDTEVHLSLKESTFRLPGDTEVALFRVAQLVAQDLRRRAKGGELWVTLETDPPSARLQVEHDGPPQDVAGLGLQEISTTLAKMGGSLTVRRGRSGGPCVIAEVGGADDAGDGAAGR